MNIFSRKLFPQFLFVIFCTWVLVHISDLSQERGCSRCMHRFRYKQIFCPSILPLKVGEYPAVARWWVWEPTYAKSSAIYVKGVEAEAAVRCGQVGGVDLLGLRRWRNWTIAGGMKIHMKTTKNSACGGTYVWCTKNNAVWQNGVRKTLPVDRPLKRATRYTGGPC